MNKSFNRRWYHIIYTIIGVYALASAIAIASCAHPPPNLSPAAVTAFDNARVQKTLNLIRDTAQDASATTPPALSIATARRITIWHRSAITIIHARGSGWPSAVTTSLDEVLRNLSEREAAFLAPYVNLIKAIITEVTR